MTTATTVHTPRSGSDPVVSRSAIPFSLVPDPDGPVRLPALRIVVGDELPETVLGRFARIEVARTGPAVPGPRTGEEPRRGVPEPLADLSRALNAAFAGIPMLDAWAARFAVRGSAVSILLRDRLMLASSVVLPPPGWRQSVAAAGAVCLAFERPPGVLAGRVPVRLG